MKISSWKKLLVLVFIVSCGILFFFLTGMGRSERQGLNSRTSETITETSESTETSSSSQTSESTTTSSEKPQDLWNQPTGGTYPALTDEDRKQLSVEVSILKQKVYIKKDNKTIYTMICSTGDASKEDQATPKGSFKIEEERGDYFSEEGTGTCYHWVSFSGHGVYLFHSIPMLSETEVNETEAAKFGTPASHGCIRLSLPDSKWFFDNIETGISVSIV